MQGCFQGLVLSSAHCLKRCCSQQRLLIVFLQTPEESGVSLYRVQAQRVKSLFNDTA